MTEQEMINRKVLLSESRLQRLHAEELREETQKAWVRAQEAQAHVLKNEEVVEDGKVSEDELRPIG